MAETAAERFARTGDKSPETPGETAERLRRAKDSGPPAVPSPEGKSQQQYEQEMGDYRHKAQEYSDATNLTGKNKGVEEDGSDANAGDPTQFHSPGAAIVGGPDGAGAAYDAKMRAGMGKNDPGQARNLDAMDKSLAGMRGEGRDHLKENSVLSDRANDARNQQIGSLDMLRNAAMGNAPSASAFGTRMAMDQGMGQVSGAMGSARGLSGLGASQSGQGAMGLANSASLAGAAGRSGEMQQNLGAYGQQAQTVAGGDLSRLGINTKLATNEADQADAWRVGNAGLLGKQGNLAADYGDTDAAYLGEAQSGAQRQMDYNSEIKAMERGQSIDSVAAARATKQANTERTRQIVGGVIQGGLTIGGAALGGPVGGAVGGLAGSTINNSTSKYY